MTGDDTHLVVGGGVIGLSVGYFLARDGHRVGIIDRDPSRRESCSDRNAGMVVPSHFIPLAAPGAITQGLRWMLDRRSPFFLRPRLDPGLWSWCWRFARHANRRHVMNTRDLLRDLSLESRDLFEELSGELGFPLVRNGLLMLCQSAEGMREEEEVADMANALGIAAEVCGPERLRELDPDATMQARGGVWFPQDAHLNSEEFLSALRRGITNHGGWFREDEIAGFRTRSGAVTHALSSSGEEIPVRSVTLAGGAWTARLARQVNLRLPLQAGKGYSFTLTDPPQLPRLCSLLKEGRVAVTPMDGTLRVAGTMEICDNDLSIDPVRLEGIVESFCRFFPAFSPHDFADLEAWSGLRPCTPDGLPCIGRAPGLSNVNIATGHAMLGLSLGPVTGRLITSLARGEKPDRRLDPDRFQR